MEFFLEKFLEQNVKCAALQLEVFNEDLNPEIRPADERFGDFQANGPMSFLKRNKVNPLPWITRLREILMGMKEFSSGLLNVEIAGPGFMNFRVTDKGLLQWLSLYKKNKKEAFKHSFGGKTVVIDYSSPNSAKRMHVGHLRSMVIGEALQRLVSFAGAKVVRDNHIGDWGTQFGLLIAAVKDKHYSFEGSAEEILDTVEEFYREANQRAGEDSAFMERARLELVKLQQGDKENIGIWEKINAYSYKTFETIYERMGVSFDVVLGESFYRDKVEAVYKELQELGIAENNEGALVVFHPEHPRYAQQPFIVRKSDGASNYASTDLATFKYRTEAFKADLILIVTDGRQRDHFEQLALTVEKWYKFLGKKAPQMYHIWFGMVQNPDGKAIKTRSGGSIKLHELLDEAVERAYQLINEKSPDLDEVEKRRVAEVVGLGAIKYADLAQERTSNYRFEWEKMINFDGNTAPYLLYAVARIYAIFRKLGIEPKDWTKDLDMASQFDTNEERSLARKLVAFPSVLQLTLEEFKPHWLCRYLFDLAGSFSSFYNTNKVAVDDEKIKDRRLLLCQSTLSTLETGLHLLGLETIQKM